MNSFSQKLRSFRTWQRQQFSFRDWFPFHMSPRFALMILLEGCYRGIFYYRGYYRGVGFPLREVGPRPFRQLLKSWVWSFNLISIDSMNKYIYIYVDYIHQYLYIHIHCTSSNSSPTWANPERREKSQTNLPLWFTHMYLIYVYTEPLYIWEPIWVYTRESHLDTLYVCIRSSQKISAGNQANIS